MKEMRNEFSGLSPLKATARLNRVEKTFADGKAAFNENDKSDLPGIGAAEARLSSGHPNNIKRTTGATASA
ncbi:hypothetical protein [Methylovirgula sp. HY1]|uniref:hypothetical protein n=1 Tax=Methylovirgula sp. HY1 TaxID=2822761 RepID=UPI001C5BD13F|nr:hypothetical protein [Methylovirgula sp. HY1]